VLERDGVAQHEVRGGKSDSLVEGKVPGLHAQHDSEWGVNEDRGPALTLQRLIGQLCGAVLGVVLENPGAKVYLGAAVADQLAHLERDQLGQFLAALAHQPGSAGYQCCSFFHWRSPPGRECLVRGVDRLVDRRVGHG